MDGDGESQHDPIVVSVDVETTGPSPAVGSMLSVGAVAYAEDGVEVGEFYATLEEVTGGGSAANVFDKPLRHSETMDWWTTQPEEAWNAAREGAERPPVVMGRFATWAESLPGRPLFLAWPAGFDWSFVSFYLWRYVGRNPFGYSPLCLKAFGAGLVRKPEAMLGSREKASFPADWIVTPEFPHYALYGARAQGQMWQRMKRYADGEHAAWP